MRWKHTRWQRQVRWLQTMAGLLLLAGCQTPWQVVKTDAAPIAKGGAFFIAAADTAQLQVGPKGDAIPESMFLEQQSPAEKARWTALKALFSKQFKEATKAHATGLRFVDAPGQGAQVTPMLLLLTPGDNEQGSAVSLRVRIMEQGKLRSVIAFSLQAPKDKGDLNGRIRYAARKLGAWTGQYLLKASR